QCRLTTGGWAEHEQQATADIRSGCGRLEIINDPRQRLVDSEQLAFEQLARADVVRDVALRSTAMPSQHVPDVLMDGTRHGARTRRQDGGEELAEGALPTLRAMQAAERAQRFDESGMGRGVGVTRERSHRPSLP